MLLSALIISLPAISRLMPLAMPKKHFLFTFLRNALSANKIGRRHTAHASKKEAIDMIAVLYSLMVIRAGDAAKQGPSAGQRRPGRPATRARRLPNAFQESCCQPQPPIIISPAICRLTDAQHDEHIGRSARHYAPPALDADVTDERRAARMPISDTMGVYR